MPEEKLISDMKILFRSNAMSETRNKSRRLSGTSKNNSQIFLFQFLLTMQVMQRSVIKVVKIVFCYIIKLIWSGPIVRNYDMKKLTKKLIIVKSKE